MIYFWNILKHRDNRACWIKKFEWLNMYIELTSLFVWMTNVIIICKKKTYNDGMWRCIDLHHLYNKKCNVV